MLLILYKMYCLLIHHLSQEEGETKLVCWSGPTDPTLSKSKKIILQNLS